jgi:hypothetical protein
VTDLSLGNARTKNAFQNTLNTTGSSREKEMTMATTTMLCFLPLCILLLLLKMK